MKMSEFWQLETLVGSIIQVFGATEEFKRIFKLRRSMVYNTIKVEMPGYLTDDTEIEPQSLAVIIQFKKWIAKTYKFPEQ